MSYVLYHMTYLMSYIKWSHGFGICLVFRTYDLMTRVDALYLPSTGHLLRILIPLEEPPHLTADSIFKLKKYVNHLRHNRLCIIDNLSERLWPYHPGCDVTGNVIFSFTNATRALFFLSDRKPVVVKGCAPTLAL